MSQQVDYRARLSPKSLSNLNYVSIPSNSASNNQITQGNSFPSQGGINVQTDDVLGPKIQSNLLYPLWSTNGVLFPYTPSLSTGNVAEYDTTAFIHTNYGFNAYIRSYPKPISLSAEFTAQTNDEALYLLAVLQFFRSVTKSYFGINPYNKAGTPPPVLLFNYLGDYQYNNVPVIIKDFSFTHEANIDYVPVNTQLNQMYSSAVGISLPPASSTGYTYVPTHLSVNLEMDFQYIPIQLRNQFNLDLFRSGALVNQGFI